MTDLSQLSDEEVNVRLAELAGYLTKAEKGYKYLIYCNEVYLTAFPGLMPNNYISRFGIDEIPRYCSSLDECAKIEAGLTDEQRHEYFERYLPAFSGAQTRDQGPLDFALFAGATARQRAEALIATLQP